jgi:hypothetical protein
MNKQSLILLLGLIGWAAGAPTWTCLIGDEDGFNGGICPGDTFDWMTIRPQAGEENGTDTWLIGPQTWRFTFSVPPEITLNSAQLEILHGGDGLKGAAEVFVNGENAGRLTNTNGLIKGASNVACLDTLDLSPFLDGLSDSLLLTIRTDLDDGWAVDYLKLTLGGNGFNGSVVPAPGALTLGSAGLLLAGWLRRRKSL